MSFHSSSRLINQDKDHCHGCHQFGHFAVHFPKQNGSDKTHSMDFQPLVVSDDPLSDPHPHNAYWCITDDEENQGFIEYLSALRATISIPNCCCNLYQSNICAWNFCLTLTEIVHVCDKIEQNELIAPFILC